MYLEKKNTDFQLLKFIICYNIRVTRIAFFLAKCTYTHEKTHKKHENEQKNIETALKYAIFLSFTLFVIHLGTFLMLLDSTFSFSSPRSLSSGTCITWSYSNAAVGEVGIQRF